MSDISDILNILDILWQLVQNVETIVVDTSAILDILLQMSDISALLDI